jgi:GTP-binding protein HflX
LLLHVVDASNPNAEDQIKAVNAVLKEIGCKDKPTLLVLNKIDRVADLSYLQVLQANHPRAVAVSAFKREGLDGLRDGVIEMLSADFANASVEMEAGNGKVLSYLAAHAEIYHQEFKDNRVTVRCYLPRHLLHHIQGPTVEVRFLDEAKR